MSVKIYVLILLLFTLSIDADEDKLRHYKANYKIAYENIDISPTEDMGLLGVGLLFDVSPRWYAGFDVYGAVRGKRGGFFTTGVDIGARLISSKHFLLNGGLFVGAGGGGSAPQGGGLMLRPYIETIYKQENFSIGAGASRVEFPNGDISSSQAYVTLSVPIDGSYLNTHIFDANNIYDNSHITKIRSSDFSFMMEHYIPKGGSLNTDKSTKTEPYTLAGVKLNRYINDSLYHIIETAGAGGGSSDGFMEIFSGIGYRYNLADTGVYLTAEALLGAAGGGKVDTGGGIVYKGQVGAGFVWNDSLSLYANIGQISSLDGTLDAKIYGATIGYKGYIMDNLTKDSNLSKKSSAWSFRVLDKSYTDAKSLFKGSKPFDRIDLLGFSIDKYIDENIYLLGQTYWAYKGGAGGYAEGVVGLGYHTNRYGRFGTYAELLGGVGGGGGVNIGGGFFASVGAGIDYAMSDNLDIFVAAAYERNKDDTFNTTAIQAGVRYNFSLLELDK